MITENPVTSDTEKKLTATERILTTKTGEFMILHNLSSLQNVSTIFRNISGDLMNLSS